MGHMGKRPAICGAPKYCRPSHFAQRPSAIIFRGLNREGVQILRRTQMWMRLRLAVADLPNNIRNAPALVLIAAGDTAITEIELFPIDSVANPGIRFRVTTGATASVLVSLGRYQSCRPCVEAPDVPISYTSEYIRWSSAEPYLAYVSNRCGAAPDETGRGAHLRPASMPGDI